MKFDTSKEEKRKKKSIVFTGGGSGGHSVVAMTLIDYFRSQGQDNISYVGSTQGLERELCEKHKVPYYAVTTGKLRRYFSFQNLLDIFKVSWGIIQSFFLFLTRLRKANIIFSTGGFVSVPAAIAGKLLGKKVYLHEQTTRVGLANKIIAKLADKVFLSFESSKVFFPKEKSLVVGYPLRDSFHNKELQYKSFQGIDLESPSKKILFITGGGNGALKLNQLIAENLEKLTKDYIVIHQTGKKFLKEYEGLKNGFYFPVAFIGEEFPDLLKASDTIICRAGAGTVSELMALQSKVLFIPLKIAQRNEQYHNAVEALKVVRGKVIEEDELTDTDLLEVLHELNQKELPRAQSANESQKLIFEEVLR